MMLALVAGCGAPAPRTAAPELPVAPPPPRTSLLAPGWIWPRSAFFAPSPGFVPGVVRPFDADAMRRRAQSTTGCKPIEVFAGLWVMPHCDILPRLAGSPAVPERKLALRGERPASVNLRGQGLDGPVKDQQQVGVCWSFALSAIMENALRRTGPQDVIAPLHLIANDAFVELFSTGATAAVVLEPSWPYDPAKACKLQNRPDTWCEEAYHVKQGSWQSDPALVAEVERAKASGRWRIVRAQKLPEPPMFDAIADVLAGGQSLYASFEIDSIAWSRAPGGIIEDYAGGDRGGHAVAVVGYRTGPRGRELLLHNSWGMDWGEGGYAWLSEAMLRAHGLEAFSVEVGPAGGGSLPPVGPGTPGTPQLPLPFPVPGWPGNPPAACPAGQVRDALLGTCAGPCPDGSPPAGGVCTGLPIPTPTPGGGQPPGPAACPEGQVPDLVTRACSPACRNGWPPAAGACMP
ncbi:MAG: C1 family peptidase [Deltaproteobacteria bacterium]|nr:C1 family peptidase [Deltaproteobacteria bacterium]